MHSNIQWFTAGCTLIYYLDGIVNLSVLLGLHKLAYGTEEINVHFTLGGIVHHCRHVDHIEGNKPNQGDCDQKFLYTTIQTVSCVCVGVCVWVWVCGCDRKGEGTV